MNSSIQIGDTRNGKGVFASMPFNRGDKILHLLGQPLNFEQTIAKGPIHEADPIQVNTKESPAAYFDTQEPGRFLNHSCDPNAGIINDSELIALRDIVKGEEVTFDYSTTMDEDHWTMICHCHSHNCRGLIRDFKYLAADTQMRYLELNLVQNFIAKQVRK